jgi:transposase
VATLGIDAAKTLFQLHGVDAHGKVVLKKRLYRQNCCRGFGWSPTCRRDCERIGAGWSGWRAVITREDAQVGTQFVEVKEAVAPAGKPWTENLTG